MKKLIACATSAIVLVGCTDNTQEQQAFNEEARYLSQADISSEESELASKLQELKSVDPTVMDAYYSATESGEKQLNVVREAADGSSETSVWPLLAGVAGGYLLSSMVSGGGVSNFSNNNPGLSSGSHRCYSREQCREQRSSGVGAYYMFMHQNASRTVRSPGYVPKYSQNLRSVVQSRSSGVFSSSSARSSGYSSGS